jgi:predicted phosphoadenosine phosphosulfate sulfurtransferase
MKIYLKQNVYEAALERIRWVFDEFPNIIVSFSGGKDSTVTLNLALQVARERGRLPLKVMFLDQEAEFQATIDYVHAVMEHPDVEPWWFQMPLRIFNSASQSQEWLNCWHEGEAWMRERVPYAKTENRYGTDRFHELFRRIIDVEFDGKPAAYLAGVRGEESPSRMIGLTQALTYKHVTWGKILNRAQDHYTFYPIYDWSYTDVWKAIHDNGWLYNVIYDEFYRFGIAPRDMRVSNIHHETAYKDLYFLQELEGETWNKLTERVSGVNTVGHLKGDSYQAPKDLPSMFASWPEYRDFLVDKLIDNPEHQEKFRKRFAQMDERYGAVVDKRELWRTQVKSVLANDYHFTLLGVWEARPQTNSWRRYHEKGVTHINNLTNPMIFGDAARATPKRGKTKKGA